TAVSGDERQMAGVHRRRYPAAMAGRRQGTLLLRFGWDADGSFHHNLGRYVGGWNARGALSGVPRARRWRQQAGIPGLARWPIPDQPARGSLHPDTDHANLELEAQALTFNAADDMIRRQKAEQREL